MINVFVNLHEIYVQQYLMVKHLVEEEDKIYLMYHNIQVFLILLFLFDDFHDIRFLKEFL